MKRYAIIAAALLAAGMGCQTQQHETSSTMEPSRGTSYGTPGMGVQSGRETFQDDSTVIQERNIQTPPETEITPDVNVPELPEERDSVTEPDQINEIPESDIERFDREQGVTPVLPDPNDLQVPDQINSDTEKSIYQEDADAGLKPLPPDEPLP
jgi:hypothetical protein